RDGLLHRLQGRPGTVPGEDPLGQLQQHLDRAVAAQGRLRARHHRHPRQPLLHPRRHRPVTPAVLAIDWSAYWQQSIFRVLGVTIFVILGAGTFVIAFLFKMMSYMQSRLGPMEAGPHGTMQLLAEVGKWLQKEDLVPDRADAKLFKLAPYIVLVSTFLLAVVMPFGPDAYFINVDTGIYLALALSSISVIGIVIAGWA